MITPRFHLTQNRNTVTIKIRAPYCNLRELEVCVEEDVYLFLCKPYYLRLNLPGQIIENDNTNSSFDADTGEFTFTYDKLNPGEDFKDLEFITKLLCKKVDVVEGDRKIEVLSTEKEVTDRVVQETNIQHGFGFALRGGYAFSSVNEEFNEVFDVDPFVESLPERRKLRLQHEKNRFNEDHYLADLLEEDEVKEICQLESPYKSLTQEKLEFTDKELDFLKDLNNVEYSMTDEQIKYCHNSLLDILYAYCYDRRTTFFEGTCESGWTIAKLSASLSWFEAFDSPKEAIICTIRRLLIYPLYRNFKLALCIFEDLKQLLKLGEKMIIKSLINMYDIFLGGDCGRYILNNLFIKDYIIYIMKWDKDLWAKTVNEVMCLVIDKKDLGLNLLQIEASINNDLVNSMLKLDLSDDEETDSDDDSSENESDDDSSEESSSSEGNEK